MKNEMIRQENRKAFPKFLGLLLVCMLIGGVFGFCASHYGLNVFADVLSSAGAYFSEKIAPWLLLAVAVLLPAVCLPVYHQAKSIVDAWDGEDEAVSEKAEEKISLVMWISGAGQIVAYFLVCAAYAAGFSLLDGDTPKGLLPLCLGIAGLLAVMFENLRFQQKSVDLTKRLYPEKTASVYDVRFRKKWMDSCDEAEKIMIGKCAYKAYIAGNNTCAALAGLLAISALVFNTGFFPSLVVCAIWLVMQCVYCKESMKLSKAGNRITE